LVNSGYTLSSVQNSFSSVASAQSSNGTAGNNAKVYALERIVTVTGTASSGGTVSTSSQWSGGVATFKAELPSGTTLALGGSAAGNYTLTGLSGSVSISTKALTVTGITAGSTTYDGTTTAKLGGTATFQAAEAAGAGTTSDGKPYNVDSVSTGGTAMGTLAAKDVGTQNVTITGVTVTGTGTANYTMTQQSGLTQTVTAKALTAQGTLSGGGKVYDGTTAATPSGAPALQGAETAGTGTTTDGKPYDVDSASLIGPASYAFNNKDVATATTITEIGLSLANNTAADYTLTPPILSASITPKVLNYSGIGAANKVYNGNTTASFSGTAATLTAEAPGGSSSDGKPYTGDTVSFSTGTLTGTFADYYVENGKPVTVTGGVTLAAGGQSGDYSVGSPSTPITANITLRTVQYARSANLALRIALSDLFGTGKATDGGGGTLSVAGVTSQTTQLATVNYNSSYLLYTPGASGNVSDSINYTVNPRGGGGVVTIVMAGSQPGGASGQISVSGGVATVKMYGIPGVQYDVQRSVDLSNWKPLLTAPPLNATPPFTASTADGSFTFTDNFSDLGSAPPSAYYRLVAH